MLVATITILMDVHRRSVMSKKKLGVSEVCGIVALAISLVLAIGGIFTYAYELKANQREILDKLEAIEATNSNQKHQVSS